LRSSAGRLGGFALVEVLVATIIIGLVFVTVHHAMSYCFTLAQTVQEEERATQLLSEKTDTIRLYTWDQVNSNGFIPATFVAPFMPTYSVSNGMVYNGNSVVSNAQVYVGRVTITNAPVSSAYTNDMRLMTVQVTWTNTTIGARTRSMSTLISRYGMQQYIYQ
jgi:Tfp pilus assembly protein PilV